MTAYLVKLVILTDFMFALHARNSPASSGGVCCRFAPSTAAYGRKIHRNAYKAIKGGVHSVQGRRGGGLGRMREHGSMWR